MLTKSSDFLQEYCATVVRIGAITPVEGSDFLGSTLVNGFSIIVRKDMISEGDVMIYCPIETQLNSDFLSANNLYEFSLRHMNSNYKAVEATIEQDGLEVAKRMVGFFNKYGRVRILKLRGQASMGFLVNPENIKDWIGSPLSSFDFAQHVGEDFEGTVSGVTSYGLFVELDNTVEGLVRMEDLPTFGLPTIATIGLLILLSLRYYHP